MVPTGLTSWVPREVWGITIEVNHVSGLVADYLGSLHDEGTEGGVSAILVEDNYCNLIGAYVIWGCITGYTGGAGPLFDIHVDCFEDMGYGWLNKGSGVPPRHNFGEYTGFMSRCR